MIYAVGGRRDVQIREDKHGHIIWNGLGEKYIRGYEVSALCFSLLFIPHFPPHTTSEFKFLLSFPEPDDHSPLMSYLPNPFYPLVLGVARVLTPLFPAYFVKVPPFAGRTKQIRTHNLLDLMRYSRSLSPRRSTWA